MMTTSHQNSAAALKPPNEEQGSGKTPPLKPQDPPLRCPRCDSPNTKFCYYNNYSLSQPRHFCKSCRRYWTRGGALRNVPVGGGSRKNKRIVKSSPSSSAATPMFSVLSDSYKDSSDNIGGGFKFFHGLASHELGGFPLNRPLINPSHGGFNYDNNIPVSCFGPENGTFSSLASSSGFSDDIICPEDNTNVGSVNIDPNLASSIESLSCLNQDLHRNLQQQRLAAMLLGDQYDHNNQKEITANANNSQATETPRLRLPFQNLEIIPSRTPKNVVDDNDGFSRREGSVVNGASRESAATGWFFGNSNFPGNSSSSSSSSSANFGSSAMAVAVAIAAASGSGDNNANGDGNMGNWHGFPAWGGGLLHHQYNNDLP